MEQKLNGPGWKILLVDDDREDYLLTRANLADLQPAQVDLCWASGYEEGMRALATGAFDAVLVDYHLGSRDGLSFMREAAQAGHRQPFILLTANDHYDLDLAAMQAGAADFLSKTETGPRHLERSLRYAIERHRLQEEARRRAAEAEESRRVLRAIMDHLPEILLIAEGPDARLRMISTHGQAVAGARGASLLGLSVQEYAQLFQVYARDGQTPLPPEAFPLARAARGEVIINEEIVLRVDDGRLITLSCNAAPIIDAGGAITGSMASMIDLTESQRMAKALRMSEARFRSIFEANVIPLAVWHADGRILDANDAYLQLVGFTRQELQVGRLRWTDLTPAGRLARYRQAIEEMAVGKPVAPFEEEYHLRSGRRVPVLIGGVMIGDYGDRGWIFAVDLTERKQAEERLAYQARLLENIHDAIIATDEEFVITAWNRAAEDLYGWRAGEVIGRHLADVVRSEITSTVFQEALELLAERGAYRLEIAQFTRDNRRLLIESSMIELRDSSGQINGYVSANRDATARIQAAAEREHLLRRLQQHQARLSAIINNAPVGILVADTEARILLANPAAERLIARPIPFGQDFKTHAAFQMLDTDGSPFAPGSLPLTRSALHGERFENLEMGIHWPDGQRRQWLINSAPILGPAGELEGAVAIFQDITERRRVAEELQRNAARIEIQHYLTRAREQERLTIAHDLHDGPLQELIGLSFALSEALSLTGEAGLNGNALLDESGPGGFAGEDDPENALQESDLASDISIDEIQATGADSAAHQAGLLHHLRGMQGQVQGLIREMRAFCNELRPPALTPFGLERAIQSHSDTFRSLHPEIHLSLNLTRDGQALPESIRAALFQVYRESLNNILKHAQATEVTVQFQMEDGSAILQVSDNGSGFPVPEQWVEFARQGHLGLVGIQERVEAIGGSVRLDSSPGQGTLLRVTVPYHRASEDGFPPPGES